MPSPVRRAPSGMTLIEILVVMAIVAVAWGLVLPRLDIGAAGDETAKRLSTLTTALDAVREEALRTGRTQAVTIAIGETMLVWDETEMELPAAVSRAKVNGENPGGLAFAFNIYPSGVSDEVRLVLRDGSALRLDALGDTFDSNS